MKEKQFLEFYNFYYNLDIASIDQIPVKLISGEELFEFVSMATLEFASDTLSDLSDSLKN